MTTWFFYVRCVSYRGGLKLQHFGIEENLSFGCLSGHCTLVFVCDQSFNESAFEFNILEPESNCVIVFDHSVWANLVCTFGDSSK